MAFLESNVHLRDVFLQFGAIFTIQKIMKNTHGGVLLLVKWQTEAPFFCISQMFFKIGVLKNFASFTGKHLCLSHFLINCRPDLKKKLQLHLKKDPNTVKNNYFYRIPLVATSVLLFR